MPLLVGHDMAVAEWVAQKLGVLIYPPFTAFGVLGEDGTLIGGAVFNCFTGDDIEVTVYGPRAMTRRALMEGCEYVFGQLKCDRLTARCHRTNRNMRRLMERLGFKLEGVQRGRTHDRDRVLYGMLRDDCKWIERA